MSVFGPEAQILDQIETICSQQGKFGNENKTFWLRIQNDIGTFVYSFLTLLVKTIMNTVKPVLKFLLCFFTFCEYI